MYRLRNGHATCDRVLDSMELRGIYQRFAFPFSNNQYLQITLNYYIQVQFQLYIRFLFISNIKDVFSNQQGFWQ